MLRKTEAAKWRWLATLMTLTFMVLGVGCVSTGKKQPAGQPPAVVRDTFFFYYLNGLWHAKHLDWQAADKNFRIAMGEKPGAQYGRSSDTMRIKTYGLHFERDYFPNRELGVCLYHQARTAKPQDAKALMQGARDYLRKSLRAIPSARAEEYLRMTEARLAGGSGMPAFAFRDLQIDGKAVPADQRVVVGNNRIRLRGQVRAAGGVESIRLDGRTVLPQAAEEKGWLEFDHEAILPPAGGPLELLVRDYDGKTQKRRMLIMVDWQAPQISFKAAGAPKHVELTVFDNLALAGVEINGKTYDFDGQHDNLRVEIPLRAGAEIKVSAVDYAGNRAASTVSGSRLMAAFLGSRASANGLARVSIANDGADGPDLIRPVIQLQPLAAERIVHDPWFVLDATVSDAGGLQRFEYAAHDDKWCPLAVNAGAIRQHAVVRVPLQARHNQIRIKAVDRHGNETIRQVTVIHRPAAAQRESLRIRASILKPVMHVHDKDNLTGRRTTAKPPNAGPALTKALANARPKRISLLDLRKSTLEARIEEGRIALHGDRRVALRLDAAARPDWLLYGYVTFWSGADEWDLQLFYEDLETSATVNVASMHFLSREPTHVGERMQLLGEKVRQRLPLVTAPLNGRLPAAGRDFRLRSMPGVLPGMRFALLADSQYGEPLRANGRPAEAVVRRANKRECVMRLLAPLPAHDGPVTAVAR